MSSAFYVSEGGRFVSTELTRGPWDPGAQHAGPPAALIARELERTRARPARRHWQVGPDHLRDPAAGADRAAAWSSAEVVRPGRSVELLAASLTDEEGELVRASAWRLARTGARAAARPASEDPAPQPAAGPRGPGRARRSRSSPPATTSATTRRWSTGSSHGRFREPRPGDGLDADAVPAGRGRGADAAAAGAGRRRLGQRRERDA